VGADADAFKEGKLQRELRRRQTPRGLLVARKDTRAGRQLFEAETSGKIYGDLGLFGGAVHNRGDIRARTRQHERAPLLGILRGELP